MSGGVNQPEPDDGTTHLLAFVRGREVACPACAYSLRDLARPVCPECGLALKLRVGLLEPRTGAWAAALVGAALGVGFHGLLLAWVVTMTLFGRGGPRLDETLPLIGGAVVSGGTLGVLLWRRAWFLRLPSAARKLVVLWSFAATLGTFAWFLGVIR